VSSIDRKKFVTTLGAGGAAAALLAGCNSPQSGSGGSSAPGPSIAGLGSDARGIISARQLSPADVTAALKTYVPSGKLDDFYMFASGGHSGQLLVIGLPSMRLLKTIPVFTPDPYDGWGYNAPSRKVLADAGVDGKTITHGDTHHPALSETNGDYDGEYVFINDKVNARVAVVSLKDFQCKQIVKNPFILSNHGNCVTPNTEYVIESSQYATPLGWGYAPLSEYKSTYRGVATYWKFDRKTGKIDPEQSFSIELPPYFQDLTDAGKLASDGWAFTNSFNTELATPEDYRGGPPIEVGASQNDMDFMHAMNWRKAEALVKSGRVEKKNGMYLIPIAQAVAEDLLFLIPEPKSPHGVDISPDGKYMIVSGKLDPHITIYSFAHMQSAIAAGGLKKDRYGIPIVPFEKVKIAQIKVGLGPLHVQFDDRGYGYSSLFLDSAIARWKVGDENGNGWELVDTIPVQYNVGHLGAPHGDTVKPRGSYVMAYNKWSLDRFRQVGPMYPRNFQLIDIAGDKMQMLYDMPIGQAEPHYAQTIDASLIKPWAVYPEVGFEPMAMKVDPKAATIPAMIDTGTRDAGDHYEVKMAVVRSHFQPDVVQVPVGAKVVWRLTNVERATNAMHGLAIPGYNISVSSEPGAVQIMEFVADKAGVYPFYCTDFCSALHLEIMGYLLVK
jgi:nitrous-oxide reductase